MIDQRLRQRNACLMDMDRRIELARQIKNEAWFAPVCSVVSHVFADILLSGIPEDPEMKTTSLEVIQDTIEQQLKELPQPSIPEEVINQFEAALMERQSREVGEANYLLGWSLAETLRTSDDPASIISDVATLAGESDVRLFGFYDGLAGYLSDASSPLIGAFYSLADCIVSNRSSLILGRADQTFAATEEEWLKETDINEVWRGRQWDHFPMYSDKLSILHALSGPQPSQFLAVCDRLLIPPLTVSVLIWPAIGMDFELILQLLELAPSVENQDTRSWNHSLVAPVLLDIAFKHLMDLVGTPAEPLAEVNETSSLARRLAETGLSRPDGRFLVVNWVRYLTWLASSRHDQHFDGILTSTIEVMAENGVDAKSISAFAELDVPEEGDEEKTGNNGLGENTSKLSQSFDYFMIASLINGADATRQKQNLRPLFQRHLCAENPALRDYGAKRLPNWRHYTIANLYLQESDPIGAWSDDWAMLATQRREAIHWSYGKDRNTVHPSLFLANVGLALIGWIMVASNSEVRDLAIRMWKMLFQSVLPCATHWSLAGDQWRSILQALFARYPNVFPGTGDSADIEALWPYLDALGGDDVLFTIAVVHLLLNGVSLDSLVHRHGTDSSVILRIQTFLDWDASCGGRAVLPQVLSAWNNSLRDMSKTH